MYECSTCGRLWVQCNRSDFTEADLHSVDNVQQHIHRDSQLEDGSYSKVKPLLTCEGYVYPVQRPEVAAVALLNGRQAAESMADGQLAKHIDEYEHRQLRALIRRRK